MNQFPNPGDIASSSESDPQLEIELLRLEQQLRRVAPVSQTVDAVTWTADILKGAEQASATAVPKVVVRAKGNGRWVLALAGSWLVGAMAGAFAMWATAPRWLAIPAGQTSSADTRPAEGLQMANDLPPSFDPTAAPQPMPHVRSGRTNPHPRSFDMDHLMGKNHQLTPYTVRHVDPMDPTAIASAESGSRDPNQTNWPDPPVADRGDAEPVTRRKLMRELSN